MNALRCLIADIPQKILAEIVLNETRQDDKIDVIGPVAGREDVAGILGSEHIDVLIMGMRDNTPHQFCRDLLKKFPRLLIVGLVDDGRMAVACLAGISSQQLVRIISLLGAREGLADG